MLLSDVHLGSDIVPHLRPWAKSSWLLREAEVDARLIALFEHYRQRCAEGRRWRLIIAGDFLDLVGVSLAPSPERVRTPPTSEERRHGLGSASDHVVRKVEAIAERHSNVFRALLRFVRDGHALVIVRGNHDIELHWHAAQRALIDAIVQHAAPDERASPAARIAICPWFFAVDGLLYVEHGHEFDPLCSYGEPLLPTCLRDSRRIRPTPFSVLLRFVARPTRGLSSAAYDYVGMGAYMLLLAKLGIGGSMRIAVRYTRASYQLVKECFARTVDGGRQRMRRLRARMRRFARQTGVSEARLEALRALYVKPAAQSLNFVLRSLYLDRVFSILLAGAWVLSALLVAQYWSVTGGTLCAIPAALLGGYACIGRGKNASPQGSMKRGAEQIAAMFRARWVVMGHTHKPLVEPLTSGSSYVNLGSWGQDDPPEEQSASHASSCTFLLIRRERGAYAAEFLRWDSTRGPVADERTPPAGPRCAALGCPPLRSAPL